MVGRKGIEEGLEERDNEDGDGKKYEIEIIGREGGERLEEGEKKGTNWTEIDKYMG